LGTSCSRLRKIIGKHNTVDFVLGFVEALEVKESPNNLKEISIGKVTGYEDLEKLDEICEKSPQLIKVRILINEISPYELRCMRLFEKIDKRLDSLIIPESLESMRWRTQFYDNLNIGVNV